MPSGDLEKSLRADVESFVSGRMSGLQEEVARLQSQFNEAFTRLLERMDAGDEASSSHLAIAVAEHLRNARNQGVEAAREESSRARASSEVAIIKAAIDDLNGQATQADILNTLVDRAAAFAPRVAFFVVKNDRVTGWRARGLEGTVGDDAIREISMPLSADTLLGEVARTRSTWSGPTGAHAEDHEIYNRFDGEPPQRIVAVPMVARDKVVAVLYADSAGQDAQAVNLEALEALVRVAGMSVELLATRRSVPGATRAAAPQASSQAEPQQRHVQDAPPRAREEEEAPRRELRPEPVEAAGPPAAEEDLNPKGIALAPQAEAGPQPSYDNPASDGATGRGAANSYEAEQPSVTNGAQSEAAALPSWMEAAEPPRTAPPATSQMPAPSRRHGSADAALPVEVGEGERQHHLDARRFARLLVSEIKLYNEQKVKDGREAGDLYERLREDIDRSREMYEKRFSEKIAGRYDYFHHELVNMLADGDSSKLGGGYPGATVAA